jgi:hypothetical protein
MAPSQVPPLYNVGLFERERMSVPYVCGIPDGYAFEKVLAPAFWTHVGHMLKAWDRIEIRPDDRSYLAEVVVTDAGPSFAKVALLYKTDLVAKSDDVGSLSIECINGKFRVLRGKELIKGDLPSKKDAQRWIDDYAPEKAA